MPALARVFCTVGDGLLEPAASRSNAYVSPVPTNAPSFGTIKRLSLEDKAVLSSGGTGRPTRRIESRYPFDLKKWKGVFRAACLTRMDTRMERSRISIEDRSIEDFPTFFYRIVPFSEEVARAP
jgi:hypothetical protein